MLALKRAIWAKKGQNEVLDHFLGQYALVFVGLTYCDRELLDLVADGGAYVETKNR